ncbi:hypothetical protein PAERUG_E5_London_17_VIM_2_12_12_03271 [Pseudomonas aeruginosa]|nr:hypothetical protein PAERUG_E5_London_17_VIM_2_12_12_03271 [Pseudomonas aeruginosa]
MQVDGGEHVPAQLGNVGHGEELLAAVEAGPQAVHRAGLGAGQAHGLAQGVALFRLVEQVEHPVAFAGAAGGGAVGDQAAVRVGLDGAVVADDHRRHARLAGDDEVVEEAAQVQAAAGQADGPALVADHQVEPDLGQVQLAVDIDVDVVGGAVAQGIEVPGVFQVAGLQGVARPFAVGLAAVVEVVVVGAAGDDEVGVVAEVAAVALGLAEEQRAARRVVFLQQPVAGHHRFGETARQRQFAGDRGEDLLPVQQGEVLRVGQAEVRTDVVHRAPAQQHRRDQCQGTGQQQRHHRFAAQPPVRRHGYPYQFLARPAAEIMDRKRVSNFWRKGQLCRCALFQAT